MITAYTFVDGLPQSIDDLKQAQWLDVTAPTDADITLLCADFDVPADFLRAPLDVHERPRMERVGSAFLLILRAPHSDVGRKKLVFSTRPLAVIITPQAVITCAEKENFARSYFQRKLRPAERTPVGAALTLALRVGADYILHLDHLDQRIEDMERTLHDSMRNEELLSLLQLQKTLIYFITAMKGDMAVLERMGRAPELPLEPKETALWEDALIEIRQASDMAEIYSQTLTGLADAMGAVVSNNLNGVMKFLTGVTIVMMIPTIFAGFYGMNVPLPFTDSPRTFYALLGLCLALCLGMGLYFRRKSWL